MACFGIAINTSYGFFVEREDNVQLPNFGIANGYRGGAGSVAAGYMVFLFDDLCTAHPAERRLQHVHQCSLLRLTVCGNGFLPA